MGSTIKRICTICARGGSKGVKNKNIRQLLGQPLIAHSIYQAQESGLFSTIAISSDSDDILDAAKVAGADILIRRPAELASDTAAKVPVIKHCLLETENIIGICFDTVVDLDATSPLRLNEDIAGAVRLLEDHKVSNVITGAPAHRSPYFNLVERSAKGSVFLSKNMGSQIVRRQDAPECFDMNASIYVWQRGALIKNPQVFYADTLLFEMPRERSFDIDSELDFDIVDFLMKRRKNQQAADT